MANGEAGLWRDGVMTEAAAGRWQGGAAEPRKAGLLLTQIHLPTGCLIFGRLGLSAATLALGPPILLEETPLPEDPQTSGSHEGGEGSMAWMI
jgi:hypothetical protein